MKKTVIALSSVAMLLSPCASKAMDMTPDTSRTLTDIFYMPEKGNVYSDTEYKFNKTEGDVILKSTGKKLATTEVEESVISESFSYGISDRLSFDFGVEYVIDSENTRKTATKTYVFNSDGFKNPVFGLTYRAVENSSNGFIADLSASFAPDVFDAEDNTSGSATEKDGTVANGGHVATLGVKVGQRMKDLSLAGFANVIYNDDAEAEVLKNSSASKKMKTDAHADFKVGLESQLRLNNELSFNVDASYLIKGDRDGKEDGSQKDISGGDEIVIGADVNYEIIPDTFAMSAGYHHTMISDIEYDYAGSSSDKSIEELSVDTFTVNARFQF